MLRGRCLSWLRARGASPYLWKHKLKRGRGRRMLGCKREINAVPCAMGL